eukprot:4989646-Amphidinium_carterae.1
MPTQAMTKSIELMRLESSSCIRSNPVLNGFSWVGAGGRSSEERCCLTSLRRHILEIIEPPAKGAIQTSTSSSPVKLSSCLSSASLH